MKKRIISLIMAIIGCLSLFTSAYAVEPGAYITTMSPHYAHPVTGEVEDAGGKESMAIGQGMTEGSTYDKALIEVDDNGNMYATIRFVLMEAISNAAFQVNDVPVSAELVKQAGDIGEYRFKIPDLNAVVRCSMHVGPMSRDVIFYMTFSGLTAGTGDFSSTLAGTENVTEEKEEEPSDPLAGKRMATKKQISSLKLISDKEKADFCSEVEKAETKEQIAGIFKKAVDADRNTAEMIKLGKKKTEAQKKIDKLEKLNPEQKKRYKKDVKQAKNEKQVKAALEAAETEDTKKGRTVYAIGGIAAIAVIALGIFLYMKKKNGGANENGKKD